MREPCQMHGKEPLLQQKEVKNGQNNTAVHFERGTA